MAAHFFGDEGGAAWSRFPSNWGKALKASLHAQFGACADPVEIVLNLLGRIGQSGALFAGGLNRMLDDLFHVDCVAQSKTLIVQLLKRFDLLQLLDIRVQHVQYPVPPSEATCRVRAWIYLWPLFRQDQLPIKGWQIVLFRKGHQIR